MKKATRTHDLQMFTLISVVFILVLALILVYRSYNQKITPIEMNQPRLPDYLIEQNTYEPSAIIEYKKNKSAKAKRREIRDRLALVNTELKDLEKAPVPASEFRDINKYLENIRQTHNITSDIDFRKFVNQPEKAKLDTMHATLKRKKEEIQNLQEEIRTTKHNYDTQITQVKQECFGKHKPTTKIATSKHKAKLRKRRRRS